MTTLETAIANNRAFHAAVRASDERRVADCDPARFGAVQSESGIWHLPTIAAGEAFSAAVDRANAAHNRRVAAARRRYGMH